MSQTSQQTISEMVRNDYRVADVFKKWSINYCCGGSGTLAEVCALRQLDKQAILFEIDAATKTVQLSNSLAFDEWPFDFLLDYIVHVHHAYVKFAGPRLKQVLLQYVAGHQTKYPHLVEVEVAYNNLLHSLEAQIVKEEEVVFPYLRSLSNSFRQKEAYGSLLLVSLQKPPNDATGSEYKELGMNLTALRTASNGYRFGEDACTNHQVIYHKLKEFDADVVQHKHLENNILFPRAAQMEKDLLLV